MEVRIFDWRFKGNSWGCSESGKAIGAQNEPEFIWGPEKFHAKNPGSDLWFGVDAVVYQYIWKALRRN